MDSRFLLQACFPRPIRTAAFACVSCWIRARPVRLPGECLRIYADDLMAVVIPERNVPARLTGPAMAALVDYLEVDGDEEYFLVLPEDGRKVRLHRGELSELF